MKRASKSLSLERFGFKRKNSTVSDAELAASQHESGAEKSAAGTTERASATDQNKPGPSSLPQCDAGAGAAEPKPAKRRKFNPNWIKEYGWMEYEDGKMYCSVCRK